MPHRNPGYSSFLVHRTAGTRRADGRRPIALTLRTGPLVPKPVTLVEVHPHRVTTLRHHAQLVRNAQPAVPLDLELRYTSLDPFAVRVLLRTADASVRWCLSRETLLLGLRRHEGIGDVAVWPVHQAGSPGRLRIRLGPLGACAVVQTERDVISDWLDVTLQLIPRHAESDHLRWDGFLASLLDRGRS